MLDSSIQGHCPALPIYDWRTTWSSFGPRCSLQNKYQVRLQSTKDNQGNYNWTNKPWIVTLNSLIAGMILKKLFWVPEINRHVKIQFELFRGQNFVLLRTNLFHNIEKLLKHLKKDTSEIFAFEVQLWKCFFFLRKGLFTNKSIRKNFFISLPKLTIDRLAK